MHKFSNIKIKVKSGLAALMAVLLLVVSSCADQKANEIFSEMTFAMDTVILQSAYGGKATKAMEKFSEKLLAYEARLSLFKEGSEILKINDAAGKGGALVSRETAELIEKGLELAKQTEGAFAFTIAPISLAWGINGDNPKVLSQQEIDLILPLVNDSLVQVEGRHVTLPTEGMGIDLGGFAKGAVCSIAQEVYEDYGVSSAWLSVGGNIYVRGTKPDGTPYRVGFRDPNRGEDSFIASFEMQDLVIAVSGGYERYFEEDGKKYIHIMDPKTGMPAESDIVSVGAIDPDGAVAEIYSTALFVWGKERTLKYMEAGGQAIMLCDDNILYVSKSLQGSFALHDDLNVGYQVEFV